MSSKATAEGLPPEVLALVFIASPRPGAFAQVCRPWLTVARDPYTLSRWFLAHYRKHEVLFAAIDLLREHCSAELLRLLVRGGANLSRQLIAVVHYLDHVQRTPRLSWVPLTFALQLSSASKLALLELGRDAGWGSMSFDYSAHLTHDSHQFDTFETILSQLHEVSVDIEDNRRAIWDDRDAGQIHLEELWQPLETSLIELSLTPDVITLVDRKRCAAPAGHR